MDDAESMIQPELPVRMPQLAKQPPPQRNLLARWLWWATIAYLVCLVIALAAMHWIGEQNWIVSVMIYMPPLMWLLPLVALTPAALLQFRKLCWIHLGCVLLVMCVYMRFHLGIGNRSAPGGITVVTNNIGENHRLSMEPFVQAEKPDIISLQDAAFRGPAYAKLYPDRYVSGQNQFVLISRFPIADAKVVPDLVCRRLPICARFELTTPEGPLIVYSVHMPTPRGDFAKLHGRGLIWEFSTWLTGRHAPPGKQTYRDALAERVELAKKLSAVFAQETQPFLVTGDFNMPDHGWNFHLFASQLKDSFAAKGWGWGYSFPGDTYNPIALFQPWMRLDYIFAGRGLHPVYCRVEPNRRSQHRAVVATLVRGD